MDKKGTHYNPVVSLQFFFRMHLICVLNRWEGKQQLTILHNDLLHDTQRLLKSSLHSSYQKEANSCCITTHSLRNLYKESLQSTFNVILLTFDINCTYPIFVYLSQNKKMDNMLKIWLIFFPLFKINQQNMLILTKLKKYSLVYHNIIKSDHFKQS